MDWITLYHRLPYTLKVMAASLQGLRLRKRRYGPETERLVQEALERETWTGGQWVQWQQEVLTRLLDYAAKFIPYYREYWDKRRRGGDRASYVYLENWPVLKKESLRKSPRAFLAEGVNPKRLWEEHTSGSSGSPLTLWRDLKTERQWYALYEARVRRWYGFSYHDPWAILGGQPVISAAQKKPPFWVWNAGLNQLYLSALHLAETTVADYLHALQKYRVRYILGYPSALSVLARVAMRRNDSLPRLEAIITNSEILLPEVRQLLRRAFGCRVVNTYGMAEIAGGASECEYGHMHIWPDAGVVEVLDDFSDQPLPPGQSGRLVLTGLLNWVMPLIRYEVGDRGRFLEEGNRCACGREMPVLGDIEGRLDDMVLTPDGRWLDVLDLAFKTSLPVIEAQIIQHTIDHFEVRVVPDEGFSERDIRTLQEGIREIVGKVDVEVHTMQAIPRGPNGKFKVIVSHIDKPAPVDHPERGW